MCGMNIIYWNPLLPLGMTTNILAAINREQSADLQIQKLNAEPRPIAKMCRRSILIVLGMFLAGTAGAAFGADESSSPRIEVTKGAPTLVLPDSLSRFINKQYPNLRVPKAADMTGPWAAFDNKNTVPYACWGHFDDKGRTDIALILLGKGRWQALSFHPLEQDQYAVFPLEGYAGSTEDFTQAHAPQEFYIYTLKAGDSLVLQGKKVPETTYNHDAIEFFSLKDPQTGILYQWRPRGTSDKPEYRYGLYIAFVFGALSD